MMQSFPKPEGQRRAVRRDDETGWEMSWKVYETDGITFTDVELTLVDKDGSGYHLRILRVPLSCIRVNLIGAL